MTGVIIGKLSEIDSGVDQFDHGRGVEDGRG